jgi:hypothetical protein
MKTALLSHGTARFFFSSSPRRFRQAIGLAALLAGVGLANSVQALTTNCVPAPDGAMAWWRAETNATDSVGGHDGVLSGGADFTAGQVGAAFWFDGLDDGVLVADAADLNVGPGQDFTIEAWIRAEPHATDFGVMSILSKRVAPNLINAQGYELALHYGKLGGQLADERQQHNNFISTGPDLVDGAYHHVAMSVQRAATNGGKLYVDGQEVLTFDPTIQPGDLTTTAPLRIGKHASDWFNGSFKGRVDEAAFYRRALGAEEIAAIYAAGSAGKCTSSNPPPVTCVNLPSGLVSWWRGEGDGADAMNQNAGDLYGGFEFAGGIVGQTFRFDGSSGHLRVADHPSLRLTNSLTVEGWIYPINISGYHCIVSKWDAVPGPNQRSYSIGLDPDGRAYLVISPSGTDFGAGVVFSGSPVPTNQWTHLAVTYDGTALRIFTNGVPSNQIDYSQGIFVGTSDLGIGANVGGTVGGDVNSPFSAPFSGLIDDLSLYRRALEPNEIAAIYAAGSAGKCGGTNPPPVFVGVPRIFNFAPKMASPGSPVSLSGTNFSSIPSNNIVYFGATRATVVSASGNQLNVIVPAGATHEPVTVTVNGLTAFAPAAFLPSFPGAGTNISTASFAPGQNLSVGDGPLKTIIADLDGDGKPDLVEAHAYAHNISIFRNIGAAGTLNASSFAPRVDFPALGGTDSPRCIAVADVDGDGKLDIVVGDQASSSVLVYRNLATPGTLSLDSFAAPVSFAAGSYPHGLRVADLNGDGLPEILVANYSSHSISILQNQGSAGTLTTNSFAPQYVLAAGPNPTDIAVADFNGDGRPDLVTTAFSGTQLSVFRNVVGPGTAVSNWFTLDTTLPALPGSLEFAVADLDGDAKSDLIVASVHGYAISVYRNLADTGAFHAGSFAARVDFGTPGWAHNVNVADFNGDGKPDLTVTGELGSYMAVFQNQSTPGSFTASSLAARVDFPTGWNAWGVAAGDLDGDDRPDIVFANTYDDTLTFYRNQMAFGSITNQPPDTNQPPHSITNVPVIVSFQPAVASPGNVVNISGRNFSSVVSNNIVYFGATRALVVGGTTTNLQVMVPSGATYAPPTVTANGMTAAAPAAFTPTFAGAGNIAVTNFAPRFNLPAGDGPIQTVIADLDGDGKPDLAVADNYAHSVSLYRNISQVGTLDANSFAARVVLPANPAGYSPYALVAADVDGDGWLDLVTADVEGNSVSVFRNQATGGVLDTNSFAAYVTFAVGAGPRTVAVADLDQDGRPEIVTANYGNSTISILRNASVPGQINASSFAARIDYPAGAGTFGIVAADLDGDGRRDIATANNQGASVSLFRNVGTGPLSSSSFVPAATLSVPAHAHFLYAADFDADGRLELVVNSYLGASMTVLRNQADPGVLDTNSFAAGITYGLSGRGHTAAFGDLNGDGKFDLIVDTEIADSIALFQNQHVGGGFTNNSLAARVDLVAGWNAWGNSVGDLDGDGRPDIVFANAYDDIISIYHNRSPLGTNPPSGVCVPPPVGLMGWWRGEGNSFDSFGTNTGTLLGGAGFAAGLVGQAFTFDGVDDAVRIPVSGPFTLPDVGIGEGFTVEAWINPSRLTIGPIFEWHNNAGGEGVHLWHSVDYITVGDGPGNLYGNIVDSSGTSHRITSPSGLLQTNQFNHVALSYDRAAGMAVIYHNGVAVMSDILGTFTPQTSYDLYLGRRPSGPFAENLFAGLIDEPSIYNRALNADEIAAIYAAGSAGKCFTNQPPPPEPPFLTQQPQSIVTNAHANVRFSVVATGSPMPAYQWYFNHAPLGGQVNASLVLANVTPNHAGDYYVIASNPSGSVTSAVATLAVLTYPPVITNQPKSIAAVIGNSASFSVGASGSAPLSYQWFYAEQPLPGRTQATLTLTNLQLSNAGNYFVRVSNPYGVTTSAVATLTVSPPPNCAPVPSGIVAWWPGQSNLWDAIGGNDAQIYQSQIPVSQLYTTGKVGSAFSFLGGFTKWIVAPPKPELNVGVGAGFTFETWLYRQSATSSGSLCGWGGFVSGYPSTPIGVRVVTTSTGAVQAYLARTNTSQFTLLTTTNGILGVNTWRHIGLSCDTQSGLAVIYVDGIAVAQTNLPTQVAPLAFQTTGAFWLGSSPNNPQLVNAILDEPTLYNRALSQAEIQSIHDAQQTGKCPPAPACLNPLLDLAGWWRGESNALDSASINHGTTVPVTIPLAIAYSTGQFGAAFSLRQGNHVVISNPPSLNVGAGAGLTIEAWINPFTASLPIVEWNSGTGTQGVYLAYSYSRGPGYLEANLVDMQGQSHVIQSPFISPVYNQWRHVAVTYDQASGAAALFVDGAVVTQTNLGSFVPRTTGNLYLGYRPPGNYPGSGMRFTGWMDEVAVYRRALSPAELRCAMRGGPNGKFPPASECLLPAEGIVSWWRGESNQLDSIQSNHGLTGITAPGYTNGQVGLAFATGLRRYLQVPTPVGLDVGAGAGMTVEGWIKTTAVFGQGTESILGWRGNQFQGQGVSLEYGATGSGSLRANLVTTNGLARYLVAPTGVIKTSQWQHVALTYDRASGWATLLVDGNTVAATNFGSFTPRTTGSFNLGWGGNFNYFTGALDEFAVYNRALSPLEIGAIARAVNGRCGQPPVIVQHPESIRVNPGSNVTFTVVANGSAPLRYQWHFVSASSQFTQNVPLPAQTNHTLLLTNVAAKDGGVYWVRVTNQYGSAVSTNIQLVVNSAPQARIVVAPLTTLLHETNLVIAPVCGAAVVYLDGGQSSDADRDPLQFTWRQGTNVLGQSVLLTNTFAPGNYDIELEASDGSLSGFAQTTLRVISPAEAVQIIAAAVSAADATAEKRGNSLFASLRAAATSFERCQLIPGLNQLHAFQEQVRAQVAPNNPDLAAAWIAAAQQLIDGVTGPAPGRSGPKFQALTRTSPGKMKLRLQAGAPQPAWVQASTNLIDWETIGLAGQQPDGTATFEDPKAGEHARRFYRIVTP